MATSPSPDRRSVVINDLKILAQAEEEKIPVILSEDQSTLSRIADRLREHGHSRAQVLLLEEGFKPGRLRDPAQDEFPFPRKGE